MECIHIEGYNIDETHFLAVRKLFEKGRVYRITRGSYEGHKRLELDYATLRLRHPEIRPLAPHVPVGVSPPTDETAIEEYFTNYIMNCGESKNEIYTYGDFISKQIPHIIDMYKTGGYGTNQAIITIGNEHSVCQEHPPCLRLIDTRVQDEKLHFIMYFRSWDCWAGLPENLGGVQLLKEYLALEIGIEPGESIISSKGLHMYDYQWPVALARLNGVLPDDPVVSLEEAVLGEGWMS
jgi:thymidylate synthase